MIWAYFADAAQFPHPVSEIAVFVMTQESACDYSNQKYTYCKMVFM